tara:strand:- start:625 stop:1323 length:699 start_codon:yes stop_codon:yes gene_type:complete
MLNYLMFSKLMENISVIIRNKNEERWIGHCIQSCLEYLIDPEIIIINDNSNDTSMDIVKSFKHDSALPISSKNYGNIICRNIDEYTPGKSLNLGTSIAKNNIILIISAHTVITKLNSIYIKEKLEQYECIFGKQIPVYRGKKINPRYIWSHFKNHEEENMYSTLEERYFLHNALSFYKRQILLDNPFDEEILGKEDRIWAAEIVKSGKKFLYSPQIEALHHYTEGGNTWKSK